MMTLTQQPGAYGVQGKAVQGKSFKKASLQEEKPLVMLCHTRTEIYLHSVFPMSFYLTQPCHGAKQL